MEVGHGDYDSHREAHPIPSPRGHTTPMQVCYVLVERRALTMSVKNIWPTPISNHGHVKRIYKANLVTLCYLVV